MGTRRLVVGLGAALALASVWVVGAANATVMEEASLEELILEADAIVEGRVEQNRVQMHLEGGAFVPHTLTTVKVSRWFKGNRVEDRLTIHEIGGVHQTGGMWIDGTPRYAVGEEVVVFLRRDPAYPNDYRTHGMVQGKFVLTRGLPGVPDVVHRDTESIAFARWTENGMTLEHGYQEPAAAYEVFSSYVEHILALGSTSNDRGDDR
ncbi:MAG: hypothetical protein AAGF12_01575 [Myxococcota bacterium]